MTYFVVLAAGRGTRVGRVGGDLHKALLPLGNKAVLSHLFELAPRHVRLVVCVGDRAQQLRDYVELAHPELDVTFVDVPNWKDPGSGPGRSLLAARDVVGDDDMVFTSCDTLWAWSNLWDDASTSWAAYAPMPAGTELRRWCRFDVRGDRVVDVLDKVSGTEDADDVYTGLAYVKNEDMLAFWNGILKGRRVDDELQVTGGLQALAASRHLAARRIDWIDTGDEAAYRRAVAQCSGYDWTKTDQATYVLPRSRRVVKYMADRNAVSTRWSRGCELRYAVPSIAARHEHMLAYEYVKGETVYERLDRNDDDDTTVTTRLLQWRDRVLSQRVTRRSALIADAVRNFYQHKTFNRVRQLRNQLYGPAYDAIRRVNFDALVVDFQAGIPHGDLNYGNVIITPDDEFVGIDWREDFAGLQWFDLRYDAAKLLAGTVVHWGRARRGDFTPWDAGRRHADVILDYIDDKTGSIEVIAALSLINSAPLHAEPLDEVLVARGCAWLERLT